MSEVELLSLKEDVAEIKAGVKELSSGLADLRVLIAGDYVRREDCQKCQAENEAAHQALNNKFTGWVVGLGTAVFGGLITAVLYLFNVFSGRR